MEKRDYAARIKEFYRFPQMAAWNATHCGTCQGEMLTHGDDHEFTPIGIVNSLHCKGLAGDIIMCQNQTPIWDAKAYLPLGEFWENLDPLCSWGGRFRRVDASHFSVRHGGVR
jgi:hypothetical protein